MPFKGRRVRRNIAGLHEASVCACVLLIGSVPPVIEGFVVALSTNVFLITVTAALCSAVNGCHGAEITQDVGDPWLGGELLEHDLWR